MSSFSTVNTKISAIMANLLQDKDFANLAGMESLQEIYKFLNEDTSLNRVLWDLAGIEIHRDDFERRLYRFRIELIEKLMSYLEGKYRDFVKSYILRYEIEDIKLVLQAVEGKILTENVEDHLVSLPNYTKVDFKSLLKEKTVKDVLLKLKNTKYYRLLLPYIDNIDDKFNFYVEMVLDKYYYHVLTKSAQNLPNTDQNITELIRRTIDMYNLEWIYRANKYFEMSKEEILNFTLDFGYVYGHDEIKEIIYSFDLEKLQEDFKDSPYKFLFDHTYDIDLFMERRIFRFIYYRALKLYKTSILKFGKVVGFIFLLEFQIKDIVSIIESKQYQLNEKEIYKFLIRSLEEVDINGC